MTPFKPEYAGKMNFYLSVVDDQLRHATDSPSIGLILCQDRNRSRDERNFGAHVVRQQHENKLSEPRLKQFVTDAADSLA